MSCVALPERGRLADEQAQTRMNDFKGEQKTALADLRMGDRERARAGPGRKEEPVLENLEEVTVAAEHQRAVPHLDHKRHADPVADIFLEPGWAREPLG